MTNFCLRNAFCSFLQVVRPKNLFCKVSLINIWGANLKKKVNEKIEFFISDQTILY